MSDVSKGKILTWFRNGIRTIENAKNRKPEDKIYVARCEGKINSYQLIREKIIQGQFDLDNNE